MLLCLAGREAILGFEGIGLVPCFFVVKNKKVHTLLQVVVLDRRRQFSLAINGTANIFSAGLFNMYLIVWAEKGLLNFFLF